MNIYEPPNAGQNQLLLQDVIDPEDVIAWLMTQPHANETLYLRNVVRKYMDCLRSAPAKFDMLDTSANRNVFACRTPKELNACWDAFKTAPNYQQVNRGTSNMFSAGMACLLRYLEYLSPIKVMETSEALTYQTAIIDIWNNNTERDFQSWLVKHPNYAYKTSKTYPNVISRIVRKFRPLLYEAITTAETQIAGIHKFIERLNENSEFIVDDIENQITEALIAFEKFIVSSNGSKDVPETSPMKESSIESEFFITNGDGNKPDSFLSDNEQILKRSTIEANIEQLQPILTEPTVLTEDEKNILLAFKATFPMSMYLGFADLMKLKVAYEQRFGSAVSLTDDAVYALIQNNAVKTADNRYTYIDNLVPPEILESMRLFIENEFSKNGIHSRVYVKPLYDAFKPDLSVAVNEHLLLKIIEIAYGNAYKADRKGMFIVKYDNNDLLGVGEEISSAIVKLLSEDVQPFSIDRLVNELPGYPRNIIKQILNNDNPKIVTVDGLYYAHIDYVYIEDNDIQKIKSIINSGIAVNGHMSVNALLREIKKKIPDVFEGNEQISSQDIMKVITQKIGDDYTYKKGWRGDGRFLPKERQ
jgi:hypothetical protein